MAGGVGDRLDGGRERRGREGVSLGPVLPGAECVEELLDAVKLDAGEVVEVAARAARVGRLVEIPRSDGELVEVTLYGRAGGLDGSDLRFGVFDDAANVGEAVAGGPTAAGGAHDLPRCRGRCLPVSVWMPSMRTTQRSRWRRTVGAPVAFEPIRHHLPLIHR